LRGGVRSARGRGGSLGSAGTERLGLRPLSASRLVFFNPYAGSSWKANRLLKAIDWLGALDGAAVHATEPGKIREQVRRHLTAATRTVFACGGDGTVSDVAAGVAGTDVALGIVPGGTTNVLAREFGIPRDPLRAARALANASVTRPLRTWTAGSRSVVLGAGVGWDARVMHGVSREAKHRLGVVSVFFAGLAEWLRYDFPRLVVRGTGADGHAIELRGTSVLVCNVRYWAGANRGIPQADPGDDLLDVVVLEPRSRVHLITFWSLMVMPGGHPLWLAGVRTARLRRLEVTCEGGQEEAHVNGDPGARTPLALEPGKIVLVLTQR
jgi:diacylglycerol kinase family enzyme